MKPNLYFLTCANGKEADMISKSLLEKRLVVCVKEISVSSSFLFHGETDTCKEVLLIMDSIAENFEKINKEVKKIHSYETYVLLSTPVVKTTKAVLKWMKEELI